MCSLNCAWINGWVNNGEAGDLRCHRAHYNVTVMCISKIIIISSENDLSPGWCQAIIWTNAAMLLIGPLGINFSEILSEVEIISFKKMHLKMSSAKWHLFRLSLNDLTLPVWVLDVLGKIGQYHGCWCPGFRGAGLSKGLIWPKKFTMFLLSSLKVNFNTWCHLTHSRLLMPYGSILHPNS